MMDLKYFRLEKQPDIPGLCIWTIDRAPVNALNFDVMKEMDRCLTEIQFDPEIKVVILTGAGKSFIAGADIDYMANSELEKCLELTNQGAEIIHRFETIPKIFIAAINGFCLGGGLETALVCDLRIASVKARFGFPEVGLGIIPGFGGTIRLPRVIGPMKAKELIYTGRQIKAEEALACGLVLKVTEEDALLEEAIKLAKSILKNSLAAVGCAKISIAKTADIDINTAMLIEVAYERSCIASDDKKEGMRAFIEKRPATFNSAKYQY